MPPVAIVGMAVLLPGAPDLAAYWRNLVSGADAITDVPAGRWDADFYDPDGGRGPAVADRVYCRRGGFVDEFAEVEVTRFGIMPATVSGTEPDQLIALNVAAAAVADAGGEERLPDRHRVGVVLGRGGYLTPGLVRLDQRVRTARQLVRTLGELLPGLGADQLERVHAAFTDQLGPDHPEAAIGLVPNLAASRVANRLDLRGPAYTVDAACASSLVAVDQAVGELASGRCDVMLAGGVHHCHDITLWSVFSQLRALSPSQRIRPFHRGADGILIGEGTGVVVLKRLADAERDGDRVYAVIRGIGVAGDGRAASLVSPHPGGQARAVRQAWRAAGLDPREPGSIGLLEAHGTATPAGDAAELATLAAVFGTGGTGGTDGTGLTGGTDLTGGDTTHDRAVIGSVKSMIGHTMPAAGVAGLVKAALAVHHGLLLPTLHCDDPHPALAPTRFRTIDRAVPWETGPDRPVRRAAVNAFGFGGINAHVVLEPAPAAAAPGPAPAVPAAAVPGAPLPRAPVPRAAVSEPERVLALAADTPEQLAGLLAADDSGVLATASARPDDARRSRLGIVDPTAKRLALARRMVAKGRPWRGRNDIWFTPRPLLGACDHSDPGEPGKLAFVFPGLEGEFEPRVDGVAAYFGLSGPAADRSVGQARVGDIGRHGAGVFGVGRLLDGVLRRMGVVPDAVAGHSVGEWTAMAAGGLYSGDAVDDFLDSFDPDALRLPGVAFAVLGAPAERVLAALRERADDRIVLSHDNAPNQSMVCGPEAPVEEFVRAMRAEGVIAQVLPFQSGFHTPMLAPCLGPIRAVAERFELFPPAVPVWSGTTASPYPPTEAAVRELFVRHLLEPVRFRLLTLAMYEAGFRAFVQVGTGQLTSLIGDTLNGREHLAVAANSPRRDGVAGLRRVATALWTEGATVDPSLPRPVAAGHGAVRSARPAAAARPPVRLDLGGALISLDGPDVAILRRELASRSADLTPDPGPESALALDAFVERFPVAAELGALLRETADTAAELIAASGRLPSAPEPPAAAEPVASSGGAAASPPTGLSVPRAEAAGPAREWRTVLRVSTDAMPYLRDHCFFQQRPGWPDEADRWPVVPATTIVQHLMDSAEQAMPTLRAVGVHSARFDQWVTATPPTDVPVTVTPSPDGSDRFAVAFGRSARGEVELAPRYADIRPAPWRTDPAAERIPDHSAAELYSERWMFHGPAFQGITEITAMGERHVRGRITTPPAPGALLDNVGQLLGYWIMATRTERTVVFPVGIRHLRFFGPHPRPGTEVECLVGIASLTDAVLEADVQLVADGEVWAELTGWQDRRFDNHPETRAVERFPQRTTLSRPRPGGWVLLHERWPDLASRELIMRNHLGGAERAEYERRPPRGRRQWLLGRIAAKDAVRQWLWERGEGPVFPAEIQVCNDEHGRPYATGIHGRTLPESALSLAHRAEAGVALVVQRPPGHHTGHHGGPGPGIDIEEIADRDQQTLAVAFAEPERKLLAEVCAATGESEARWATAFWAAKEAVAKAEGTGFLGRPRDFAVVAAEPERLLVEVAAAGERPRRRYRVHSTWTVNPPGLPSRDYAVAWTTGPADETEETDQ
ncbi:beta-ketoacyl synthase N-terminal-like domain-containing protein [Streptomyces sp. 8N616]|uniref:beta-ketoacyl synthase N-terminal-like domain-containing protein n=1 Tax=Streptomyces sp. 8N616 TaxID=3457414 RepID=UPI003FD087D2